MAEEQQKKTEKTTNEGGDSQGDNATELLKNLKISEEAKAKINTDADLANAMQHLITAKREANAEAKKNREQLEQIQTDIEKKTKEDLAKKGEFEKLYKETQKTLEAEKARNKELLINNKLSLLAAKKGLKKEEYLKLFDASTIQIDENLNVTGAEEAFEKFFKENPELFGTATVPKVESGQPSISKITKTDEVKMLEEIARKSKNPTDIARWQKAVKESQNK